MFFVSFFFPLLILYFCNTRSPYGLLAILYKFMVVQIKLHVFVVHYLYIFTRKMAVLILSQNKKLEQLSQKFNHAFVTRSLFDVLLILSSNIPCHLSPQCREAILYACSYIAIFKKNHESYTYTFFLSFCEGYTIWVSIDTVYVELKLKIFVCLSLNVLLEDFICNSYSFYTYFADLAFQKKYWRGAV